MKLSCKIEVSDNISKLFEDFGPITVGELWEIFLSAEGKAIDNWIDENKDTIQASKGKNLSKEEMKKIVHFAIQSYGLQKGLAMYLEDPGNRRLKDDISITIATMGFVEEALDFCKKQLSDAGSLRVAD